jgi:photosystem II stability/assembly factor-like uncharacterized protein
MRVRVSAALVATMVGALITATGAAADVSVGHSDWFWGNPGPQGEPLSDVSFAGGTGYAVGTFGTVMRTDDAGTSWTGLPSGTTTDLTRVDAVSPNTVVVAGRCVLRRSDDGGRTFARLAWIGDESSCPNPIAAVDFPTATDGFLLLQDGTMLRTGTAGQSWGRAGATPDHASAIWFSSATTGVAAGSGIDRTSDGGRTWSSVGPAGAQIAALAPAGPDAIDAIGPDGSFYTSSDAGQSWTKSSSPSVSGQISAPHLACASPSNCLVSIAPSGGYPFRGAFGLFATTDGGKTFKDVTPKRTGLSPLTPSSVALASPTHALAVTREGIPAGSSDGGATFTPLGDRLPARFDRLRVVSDAVATMRGPSGTLARTADGGRSWQALATPSSSAILDTSFVSAANGFALDAAGSVLRTDDGGTTWQTLSGGAGQSAILALDSNHVLLAGPRGVMRSSDGGHSFIAASGRGLSSVGSLARAGRAVLAWGPGRAFISSTAGASFSRLSLPRHGGVRQLDFVNPRTGFLLGVDDRVSLTVDAGRHWRELLALGHTSIASIAFANAQTGWAAEGWTDGTSGAVLRTDDGGQRFRAQRVNNSVITELGAYGRHGYAESDSGRLFGTASTGDLGAPSSLVLRAPRRAGKHGSVTVAGHLRPGLSGMELVISYRATSGGDWSYAKLLTGAGGSFSFPTRIRKQTAFVVHWDGDEARRAAGSAVAVVALK